MTEIFTKLEFVMWI